MTKEPYYEITKTINNLPINIIIHKKSPIQIIEAHWHRALELSIVFEGEVEFHNENRIKICKNNEVNLSNCEEIHYSIPQYKEFENANVGYTLQINYNFLYSMIPDINEIYFDISDKKINQKISQYMINIYELYESNNEIKYIKIYVLVLEILGILYEKCKNKKTIISTKKTKEIIKYIHLHYQEDILLYEVAQYFGFSREYFSRFFKQEIGCSFKNYLTCFRLNKSLNLLKNKELTILEISSEVGFSSEIQFINSFKKYYHMTPGEYRKSQF